MMADLVSVEHRNAIVWHIDTLYVEGPHCWCKDFSLLGSRWMFCLNWRGPVISIKKQDKNKYFRPFYATSYFETPEGLPKCCQTVEVKELSYGGLKIVWEYPELAAEEERFLFSKVTFVLRYTPIDEGSDDIGKDMAIQTPAFMDTLSCLNSLSLDFLNLLEGCVQPDIKLKCGDTTIPAHRIVLCARSPVFAAMLNTEMTESLKGCIEILDISPSILLQLVKYIYSAKAPKLSESTAPHLYEAADKYEVKHVKNLCADFMVEHLTKESACNHLVLFDAHGDNIYKEFVVSFIADKDKLINDAPWQIFCKNYPKLSTEVLNRVSMKK